MSFRIASLLRLYQLPTGRRAFAHRQVLKRATERGLDALVAHVTAAHTHDHETLRLERQRLGTSRGAYTAETHKLDTLVDRCVVGLKSYLDSQQQSFLPPHPRYQAAEALLQALFPTGASDIVRLSYAQEYEAVSSLLKGLDSDELKPHVEALPDLSFLIANLRETNAEYGASLSSGPNGPSGDELRVARDRGHELLAWTVVLIAAQYTASNDSDEVTHLLQPIMQQNEAMRLARQRRRQPLDVNPDTGDEETNEGDPDEPIGDPIDGGLEGGIDDPALLDPDAEPGVLAG